RRRPAGEDRPGLDGLVARGARAVSRHGGDQLRAVAARAPQGSRPREEAAPAQGGYAAPAAAGGAWAQARLLDPGRGVASERASRLRTRDARPGDASPSGIPAAGGGDRDPRRARLGPRGPVTAAVGAARLHPLARAPRRGRPPGCTPEWGGR